MRTVITGGAGFVGSHLCERFLGRGRRGPLRRQPAHGTPPQHRPPAGQPAVLASSSTTSPSRSRSTAPVDNVLHFASPASPVDYLAHPIPTLKVGSLGTHNALGLAKAKDARFLLASTSEVYGDPEVHPQREDYWGHVNPIGPRGCYDEAKRFAEAITMAYHRYHGVKTRIVRIFNTYGPRMRLNDGRVLPAFMGQVLRGEPTHRLRPGRPDPQLLLRHRPGRRHLPPAPRRLLRAGQHRQPRPRSPSSSWPRRSSRWSRGPRARSSTKPFPQDDPKRRKPDITRAQKLLGWNPTIDRAEGLKRTLEYFRDVV